VGYVHQVVLSFLDGFNIVAFQGFLCPGNGIFNLGLFRRIDLIAEFLDILLDRINHRVGLISGFNQFFAAFIFFRVHFRVLDQFFNIRVAQTAGRRDLNTLLLAGPQILGIDMHYTVGVNVKSHFDLRYPARRGRNTHQFKAPQRPVIRRHLAFALKNMNAHSRLIIRRCGENLAFLCGDSRIFFD